MSVQLEELAERLEQAFQTSVVPGTGTGYFHLDFGLDERGEIEVPCGELTVDATLDLTKLIPKLRVIFER